LSPWTRPCPAAAIAAGHAGDLDGIVAGLRDAKVAEPFVVTMLVNKAFWPMFLNFLCSFRSVDGPIPAILFLAQDEGTHKQLLEHGECSYLIQAKDDAHALSDGSRDLEYGQLEYQQLMQRRTSAVMALLERNVSVLLEDADTMWLRNPVAILQHQVRKGFDIIGEEDTPENICGGFLLLRATEATKDLWRTLTERHRSVLQDLITRKKGPQLWSEQSELNRLLYEMHYVRDGRIRLYILPASKFPNGTHVFAWNWELAKMYVLHNNFSRGAAYKRARFQARKLWIVREGVVDLFTTDKVCRRREPLPLVE
jgi:hypothetical protein